LFLSLALVSLAGCVTTPSGKRFDPVEGVKRLDENVENTIDRMQTRDHDDRF